MLEFPSIVGGEPVMGREWIEVRNPYSGNLAGRVSAMGREEVQERIQRLGKTRVTLSRYERQTILNRMGETLSDRASEVSKMITDESGLCLKDTRHEVLRACDVLRFAAIQCLADDSAVFPCDVSRDQRPRRIYTMRQPLGLVCAITPFNHPLNQVIHKVAPAIAAGAKILLKPSQLTPLTAHYLVRLAVECGLPPEGIAVVNFASEDGAEAMVSHPAVNMVTFTGSTVVGKRIAAIAAYKRLVLELGGSSPMLVLADADPAQAAAIAVAGTFMNSGQRCTAVRRLLVHESIADRFAQLLVERTEKLKQGDPYDPATDMGTVISEKAAREIERRVDLSIAGGAKLLTGHRRRGASYAPTVLDFVSNESPVVACETFGPVAPILRFRTLDEAIQIANDTEFGLSGAVVSNHWPSIQRVISELETGTVNVNEAPSYRLEWSPFGGIKSSGLGYKEGVIEAMKSMTYVKTYSLPWEQP